MHECLFVFGGQPAVAARTTASAEAEATVRCLAGLPVLGLVAAGRAGLLLCWPLRVLHRPGDEQIGADARERVEHLALGIVEAVGHGGDRDDHGHADAEPEHGEHRAAHAPPQLAAEVGEEEQLRPLCAPGSPHRIIGVVPENELRIEGSFE